MLGFSVHAVDASDLRQNHHLWGVHQSFQVRDLPLHRWYGEFRGVPAVAHTDGNAATWPVCTLGLLPWASFKMRRVSVIRMDSRLGFNTEENSHLLMVNGQERLLWLELDSDPLYFWWQSHTRGKSFYHSAGGLRFACFFHVKAQEVYSWCRQKIIAVRATSEETTNQPKKLPGRRAPVSLCHPCVCWAWLCEDAGLLVFHFVSPVSVSTVWMIIEIRCPWKIC